MNMLKAEEALLSFYQLNHDPFAARVPNFKFFPAQRKIILGQLHHLARHSQLLLLITGIEGSGKTLLRQALIASINKETIKVINILAADSSKVSDILRLFANELALEEITVINVIERIKALYNKGVTLYLMIDDAERLSDDVIHLLLNLSNEQLMGVHIFLFARPDFLEKLESTAIGQEVTFNLPLTPYTMEETKDYLALRLEGAGQDLSLFTETQITDIYIKSGGWPGVINQLANDCLIENMRNHQLSAEPNVGGDDVYDSHRSTKVSFFPKLPLSNMHLVMTGVLAVCMVTFLFFSDKTPSEHPHEIPTTVVSIGDQVAPLIATSQAIQNTPTDTEVTKNEPTTQNIIEPIAKPTAEPVVEPIDIAAIPTTKDAVVDEPSLQKTEEEPKKEEPKVAEVTTPSPIAPVDSKLASVDDKNETPTAVAIKPIVKPMSSDNAWYIAQRGGYFTIQVGVARTEKAAMALVNKQGSHYHYFKRLRSNKIDYVVTHGNFTKRTEAQQAIKKLPIAIQRSKPWVRTFASIKQELTN